MPIHRATSSDCITKIADANGFFWETVWNHPENESLKSQRKDPNVLQEGDEVFVPELTTKEESGATEKKHRFRKKGVPALVRLRVMINDKPIANADCVLTVDGVSTDLKTDADGYLEMPLPPGAQSGELKVKQGKTTTIFPLQFGGLDPIDTDAGVAQRLKSLGYPIDSQESFDEAVKKFRKDKGLSAGGVDGALRDKLKSEFGQ